MYIYYSTMFALIVALFFGRTVSVRRVCMATPIAPVAQDIPSPSLPLPPPPTPPPPPPPPPPAPRPTTTVTMHEVDETITEPQYGEHMANLPCQ